MTIKRENNEIVIRIPDVIDPDKLQQLINYLSYQEKTSSSTANQEEVNKLASEVNKDWWKKNKDRLLK
jgi:uncharacterized protein (DUF39 family)